MGADYGQISMFGRSVMMMRFYGQFIPENAWDMKAESRSEMGLPEAISENGFFRPHHICIQRGWGRKGIPA